MAEVADDTVAIIGLGLMGGSLARDLAARGVRVFGYDAEDAALAEALDAGVVAHALDASLHGLADADVLVLAVPVDVAATVLEHAAPRLQRARLITDVGSAKAGIARAAAAAGIAHRFVGAHPLTGDERAGFAASRDGLFVGARVFLCPTPVTDASALDAAERLWSRLGAHTEIVDAEVHDRTLAWTSHVPQTLATTLAVALNEAGIRRGDLGSGGRAMTRLAASSPDMWTAIATENGAAIAAALDDLDAVLQRVRRDVARPESGALHDFFHAGRAWANGGRNAAQRPASRDSGAADGEAGGAIVAFQGELGAFGEGAVRAFFAAPVQPLPCRTFAEVGDAVLAGRAAFGMLPIENSTAGSVVGAYEVLARPGLAVIGEVVRPIRHALLGVPGSSPGRVRRVLSHPVALAQCSAFFAQHRWLEGVAFYDTAGAAREVAHAGDPSVAAIAAEEAAERYQLDVLARDVHDRDDNRTRFLAIALAEDAERVQVAARDGGAGRDAATHAGGLGRDGVATQQVAARRGTHARSRTKSTLLLDTADTPGSLAHALAPFAARGVNLAHIQSTPGETPWTYRFIIELDADAAAGEAKEAIREVRAGGAQLRVLGSYRAG